MKSGLDAMPLFLLDDLLNIMLVFFFLQPVVEGNCELIIIYLLSHHRVRASLHSSCSTSYFCRYTNMLNGYTAIALTKVDILDDLDEVKIGVNYVKNGEIMKHYPSSEQDYVGVSIEYLTMPGWKTDISKCRNFEDLPLNAQNYVLKIEEILGVPIWWIGVGQARLAMVDRVPSNVTLF